MWNICSKCIKYACNRTGQCLLYADDVTVLGRAVKHVEETIENTTVSITDWLDQKFVQNQTYD
jgi:hypothetical protein